MNIPMNIKENSTPLDHFINDDEVFQIMRSEAFQKFVAVATRPKTKYKTKIIETKPTFESPADWLEEKIRLFGDHFIGGFTSEPLFASDGKPKDTEGLKREVVINFEDGNKKIGNLMITKFPQEPYGITFELDDEMDDLIGKIIVLYVGGKEFTDIIKTECFWQSESAVDLLGAVIFEPEE